MATGGIFDQQILLFGDDNEPGNYVRFNEVISDLYNFLKELSSLKKLNFLEDLSSISVPLDENDEHYGDRQYFQYEDKKLSEVVSNMLVLQKKVVKHQENTNKLLTDILAVQSSALQQQIENNRLLEIIANNTRNKSHAEIIQDKNPLLK